MIGVAKLALHLGDKDTALQVLCDLTDNDEVIDALYDEDQELIYQEVCEEDYLT